MKNIFTSSTTLALLLMSFSTLAQDIRWNAAPRTGFVFEINNKEAQKLLTVSSPDTIISRLLRTPLDTFNVKKGWIKRPAKGHFILARIEENKLHCEYTSVFPYQVFLLREYDALALQVLDMEGNVREDAKVKFKLKRLRIDPQSKTYRIENDWFYGTNRIVTVELDGFRSVFNIEKHEVPEWYNRYHEDEERSFYSYLITDKNKYKPNEKVRFKSFALSPSRSPLHRELTIQLVTPNKWYKLGKVAPHRPGSFTGEFQLHDSLKLTLDRPYSLYLTDKNDRVVANCTFRYEDYELNGNKLEVHLATDKQFHPSGNELSITATDANGLPLKDARATIVVRTQNIRETFQPLVILKDTLLFKEINLDPNEATRLTIPSTLFQKTNTAYYVVVSVRNTQNQLMEKTVAASHYYAQYELTSRFSNDSIVYELFDNGKPLVNVPMNLTHDGELTAREVRLPFKEKINPVVSTVDLKGEKVSRQFVMRQLLPQLELTGGIAQDSFKIQLINPQQIETSWYVYQGSELLQKGFGREIDYKSLITDREQTYYVELLYSFGGEDRIKRKEYEFREGSLNVSLNMPERAYPGQEVEALIKVTNQQGHPVNGVDLTALAVNGKLDYYLPDLPYYGSSSMPRSKKATYSKSGIDKRTATLNLEYKKWESRARLDTMKYYQFTYPWPKMFVYTHSISDSTQFAPYVMRNGMAEQVYVIEVNQRPVYFSWADEPRQYSFYVSGKKKSEITLRLHDRVLIFDSLQFVKGKKTILSVDLDHLPPNVRVHKIQLRKPRYKRERVYPEFTPTEISRYAPLLSSFKWVEGNAYLEGSSGFKPLFSAQYQPRRDNIIVGPLIPGMQTFIGERYKVRTSYQHTGGYTYAFEDNIVYKLNADRLIPDRLLAYSYKPMTTINDRVMTKNVFLEEPVFDHRWHTRLIDLVDHAIRMKVLLPEEKAASGFAAFLFENSATKEIISPCQSRYAKPADFFTIPRGLHNVIVIYNNGTYLKMDSIELKSHSHIIADLNHQELHAADSLSRKWQRMAERNCYNTAPKEIIMRESRHVYGNIKGVIYDEEFNSPVPGANIIIKGTVNGTVTDAEGRFALDADESMVTLVISFIGYATKEVDVQIGSELTLYMQEDVKQLSEVVVTGYGGQTQRDLTSSVSYALQGRVAGVQISGDDDEEKEEDNAETVPDKAEAEDAERRFYHDLLTLNTIRSHFSDVGFWEPKLFTDKEGQSQFKIKYPDDITRWEATVYAMNRQLQTGTTRKTIKSYKPIMAELLTPQFLTQGDSSFFIGKVSNYTDDKNITGKVKWSGSSTDFEKDIRFSEYHADKLAVHAAGVDSLALRYVFTRDDGYLDGEERKVPVTEQGIICADGTLSILKNKEEVRVKASAKEDVVVDVLANQLDIYAGEARYLLNYKYDCNEQLASKLTGLINYRILMKYESKPFKYDKDVNRIIARLLNNQNKEFLWSWWDVSDNTSYWMSAHILRALKLARDAGYLVELNIENLRRKAEYKFEMLRKYDLADIDLIHALASWQSALNYTRYVYKLDSIVKQKEEEIERDRKRYHYTAYSLLKEKLLLLETRQLTHLPYVRDSLMKHQKKGIMGDIYFSDERPSRYWYSDDLSINTVAYHIIKNDSSLHDLLTPMQLYFISKRNRGEWNTYHSSNILTSVLPDLLKEGVTKKQEASLKVSGKVNETITQFPYHLELRPEEEVTIRKESGLPVYFMQYRKERVTRAKTGVEGFEIKTTWNTNQNVLEAGKPVQLTVEVNVKKEANMEYVMIEVPIPGACSYEDKTQNENAAETHREYFKERTVIFCEKMKVGKYTFNIRLLPRFTGKYMINPAQVSLMYVPVMNANTDMKSVKVN